MAIKVVVVTGATGFIGAEIVKGLLDRGYIVRAVVRSVSPETTGPLEKLAAALPGSLELHTVPDILAESAYNNVVVGADYVIHCASPVTFGSREDPETLQKQVVDPAVKGATNILQAVARHAKDTIRRIVLTSSNAAVMPSMNYITQTGGTYGDHVFSEAEWNSVDTLSSSAYHTSKVQAEQAAWDLAKEHGIDLVTVLPSLVIGPALIKRGGISIDSVKNLLEGGDWKLIPRQVDVRDVALAHIRALEIPSAKGRYLLSHSHTIDFQTLQHALEQEFPEIAFAQAQASAPKHIIDSSRVQKELGISLIPATRSIVDEARTLLQLGVAKPKLKVH